MRKLILSVLAFCLLLVAPLQAQVITYSETFTTGLFYCPGDPEYDNWGAFRAQLDTSLISFISVTIKGDLDPVGKTCTDLTMVMQMAGSLKDGVAGTWLCGAEEFNVGVNCLGGCAQLGDDIEFNATPASSCTCSDPGYILRPCIGNQNWGGINGITCSAPTQIMTVEFEYISYCTPTYTNKCSTGDYIDGVVFTDIGNVGSGCNGNANNYTYYSKMEANIAGGLDYPITLTPSSSSAQGFGVWMDYNGDNDFADAGEFALAIAPGVVAVTDTIFVPAIVTVGRSRMRVRSFGGVTPTAADSCSNGIAGETEDYVLQIKYISDLGVVLLDSPITACGLTTTENIVVQVYNFGAVEQDSIPVAYSIDGGPPVIDTLFAKVWPGDSATFTFTTPADLSIYTSYNIDIWTIFPGDSDLSNDSSVGNAVVNIPIISTLPYFEDFETGAGGWDDEGASSTWELGTPSAAYITGAASGSTAWVTNLNGFYAPNELSYLVSPCMDFSGLTIDPSLLFSHIYQTQACCDEGWVDYSIDGGNTWFKLGTTTSGGQNWYNMVGLDYWNDNSGNAGVWRTARHRLTGLAGQSNVRVRFVFSSDAFTSDDGFGIDNIMVKEPDSNDVGVISIDAPVSGCGLTATEAVTIAVRNWGINAQDTIPVAYTLNGGPMVVDTIFPSLASGSTASFTFSATVNLSANGSYTLDAWIMLAGDADMTNDSTMGYLVDNPLVCCIPTFTFLCTSNDFIDGVEFAGIINTGTGCNGNPDNYIFYSSPTASVSRGITFPITLTPASTFDQGFGVWIDFNIDGDFSDAGEFVFSSPSSTSAVTGNITIPLTSSVGVSVMRVRCIYALQPVASDDCSLATFGETEDYVIYISDPQPNDVGVISINTPMSGCGLSSAEDITVTVMNFGTQSQDTIPVGYNIDGGAPVTDTIHMTLASGQMTTYVISTPGDFSTPATYFVNAWTDLVLDTNPINDSTLNYQVSNLAAGINSYPYLEDMETFTPGFPGTLANGWTNATGDDMDWTVNTGTTGSAGTGPTGDHTTGTGIYLYTEASGFSNMTAELLSPCIDLDSICSPVLEVWYHMFGLTMGNLVVEVFDGANWIAIGGIAGPQQTQNADPWLLLEIPVPCSISGIVQFKFIGQTGTSFTSDICIDDIVIREGAPPSAEFSADTSIVCTGSAISFVDSNTACNSSWLWDFGDGNTDTSESPLHAYSDTGKYTVSLIVSNDCGTDTVTKPDYFNITVKELGNANCIPSVLDVNNDVGIYDVTFNTISNPTGTLTEAYTDYSCSHATTVMSGSSQLLEVETGSVWQENVRGWIDYNNDGIFDGSELVISTDDAVQTHSAQFIVPQGVVFDTVVRMRIASDYFAFAAPGSCDTLGYGQVEDYGVTIIEAALPPEATFSYASVDVCTGEVLFTDESTFFPTSWVWNFGDGVIDSTGPVVTHTYTPGTYNTFLIVTNQFGADTIGHTITIDPIIAGITGPDTIYEGNTVQFESNSAGNGDTWLWDFGNTGGSTWEDPTTTYVTTGTYTVTLQVSNSVTGCMDSAAVTIVVLGDTTGISTVSEVSHIAISPNPTHDRINIVFGNNYREEYQLSITDFMGRAIFGEVIQVHGVHTEVVDMSGEAFGVYFVRIINDSGQVFIEKLVLE